MSVVLTRPFKFANRVLVDGKQGIVIESNSEGFKVQFVTGTANIKWLDLAKNPHRVKHDVTRRR